MPASSRRFYAMVYAPGCQYPHAHGPVSVFAGESLLSAASRVARDTPDGVSPGDVIEMENRATHSCSYYVVSGYHGKVRLLRKGEWRPSGKSRAGTLARAEYGYENPAKRAYVGYVRGGHMEAFTSATKPNEATHGHRYFLVTGPFSSLASAKARAEVGLHPVYTTVAAWEKHWRHRGKAKPNPRSTPTSRNIWWLDRIPVYVYHSRERRPYYRGEAVTHGHMSADEIALTYSTMAKPGDLIEIRWPMAAVPGKTHRIAYRVVRAGSVRKTAGRKE